MSPWDLVPPLDVFVTGGALVALGWALAAAAAWRDRNRSP